MPEYRIDSNGNAIVIDDDTGQDRLPHSSKGKWSVFFFITIAVVLFFLIRNNFSSNSIVDVSIGNNSMYITQGETTRASFKATSSGTYIFTTTGNNDTYGSLLSTATDSNAILSDDDSGIDHNFKIEYSLSSNQTVYIGVKFYDANTSGNINLNITRKPDSATQTTTVVTGNSQISVRAGQIARVRFVAPSSGTYVFTSTGSEDTYGYLYNSATSTAEIRSDDDSGTDNNFRIEYTMSANQSLYVGLKFYSNDKSGTINLNISRKTNSNPSPSSTSQITTVSIGTTRITVRAGQITRVQFIAPSSGIYVFTSTGTDDTYGYLYNSATSTSAIESDDDNGTNNNFRIVYSMSSNQSIYVGVKFYSAEKSGTISLSIRKNETTQSWPIGSTCSVIVQNGNARTGPGTDYDIAGHIYSGDTFTILDSQIGNTGKDWFKVNNRGTICWISSGLVDVGGHREGTINGVPIY